MVSVSIGCVGGRIEQLLFFDDDGLDVPVAK
jgi:hypothetical protein